MERKLAAIMAADVAGYSRLMGENAEATLAALRRLRNDLFAPSVENHRGTLVKSMGDGWLVEFGSAVDAINCAVVIQEGLRTEDLIDLRIGVHVGDIVFEDEDVFGDGVNIAARLQEIAAPGGIVISDFAHASARGAMTHAFADGGPRELKNITMSVGIHVWGEGAAGADTRSAPAEHRPSILVLPFAAGDDPAALADGLTDAVITALSRFSWFLVLARATSLTYKGRPVDIADLRRRHGAAYVLEANLRTAGNRVRVGCQLLDTDSGHPIWTDQFDGTNDDPFELEDRITRAILAELTTRLLSAEQRKARFGGDGSAWDLVMQGRSLLWRVTEADVAEAQELFRRATELEPDLGLGQADLAWSYVYQRIYGWGGEFEQVTDNALAAADRAIAADGLDAYALAAASQTRIIAGHSADAVALGRRALEINPNLAIAYAPLALGLCQLGDYDEAYRLACLALEMGPNDPARSIFRAILGIPMLMLDKTGEMIENARAMIREFPDMPTGYRQLAAAYALEGRGEEARRIVEDDILRLIPGHTATESGRTVPFGPNEDIRGRWVQALIDAGLPE